MIIAVSMTPSGIRLWTVKEISAAEKSPPQVWLRIAPDDIVTVYIGKSKHMFMPLRARVDFD